MIANDSIEEYKMNYPHTLVEENRKRVAGMSVTMMSEVQTWTGTSIDTALVHINAALARLRRSPKDAVDNRTSLTVAEAHMTGLAVEEARQLKLYLEQNPSACTADGLTCCRKLLEVIRA